MYLLSLSRTESSANEISSKRKKPSSFMARTKGPSCHSKSLEVSISSYNLEKKRLLLLPSIFPSISLPMSQFFTSGGQSIGVSASASVLPVNIQGGFPLVLTGLISLQSKGLSRVFLQHHSSKTSILQCSAFFIIQLSHPYMTIGKTIALTLLTK